MFQTLAKNSKEDFIQDNCSRLERLNPTLNTAKTAGVLQPMSRVRESMDEKLLRGI